MDYYKTLGIKRTATATDIKTAYRRLASKHHPDKGGDAEKFKEIKIAYDCLHNPKQKVKYDTYSQPSPANDFHKRYNDQYDRDGTWDHANGKWNDSSWEHVRRNYTAKNKDIHIAMQVTLTDTLEEQNKVIDLKVTGETLNPINITIPKGVQNGHTIRYSEVGSKKFRFVKQGDVLVEFVYAPHMRFEIINTHDIKTSIVIMAFDAMLGKKIPVKTLDGTTLIITVPKGTQPGTLLKIPNKGLYKPHAISRGHLYVAITVIIPTLSKKEEEIIHALINEE